MGEAWAFTHSLQIPTGDANGIMYWSIGVNACNKV